jgi:hypothetical protein
MGQARYASSAAVCSQQLLVCGGQDNVRALSSVEVLDAERGWLEQAPMGVARKYHAASCVHRCGTLASQDGAGFGTYLLK